MNEHHAPSWEDVDPTAIELRAAAEALQLDWERSKRHYEDAYQRRLLGWPADPTLLDVEASALAVCRELSNAVVRAQNVYYRFVADHYTREQAAAVKPTVAPPEHRGVLARLFGRAK
jgi:hypothetical protein